MTTPASIAFCADLLTQSAVERGKLAREESDPARAQALYQYAHASLAVASWLRELSTDARSSAPTAEAQHYALYALADAYDENKGAQERQHIARVSCFMRAEMSATADRESRAHDQLRKLVDRALARTEARGESEQ